MLSSERVHERAITRRQHADHLVHVIVDRAFDRIDANGRRVASRTQEPPELPAIDIANRSIRHPIQQTQHDRGGFEPEPKMPGTSPPWMLRGKLLPGSIDLDLTSE